jgi:hypothetical protein
MNNAFTFGELVGRSFSKTAQTPSRAAFLGGAQKPPAAQINPAVAAWGAAPSTGIPQGPRRGGYFDQIGSAARSAGKDLYDFATDPELRTRTVAAIGQNADKYLGTNTGMNPDAITPKDVAPVARTQDTVSAATGGFVGNLNDRVVKPTIKFVDQATDPNVGLTGALGLKNDAPVAAPAPPPKSIMAGLQGYGTGLKDWAGKNPWLAGGLALGLGGLGAYGLYDLLRSRRRRNRQPYYDYDAREF